MILAIVLSTVALALALRLWFDDRDPLDCISEPICWMDDIQAAATIST